MKTFFTALVFLLTSHSFAAGDLPKYKVVCLFDMPIVHPVQEPDPYEGGGQTITEAKRNAFKACLNDLEPFAPGQCQAYYSNENLWACSPEFQDD